MSDIGSALVPVAASLDRDVWTVHQGDARNTRQFLAEISRATSEPGLPFLTATITSPPYANLVDYGPEDQIGFGQTYDRYLAECEQIFASVHEWTREDGALWLVADTLMAERDGGPSALMPLPFALADRASKAGWVLRDVIIWRKDRTRPWAGRGKLRNGFEYVLFFVKSSKFKHHVDRLRDLRSVKPWWVKYPERYNPWGMTPDNVWDIPIPVQGSWASNELRHACPFPAELVRRIVELSTDEGDIVFDPFSGSGMVAAVAEAGGRVPLGTELNPQFCEVYETVIRPTTVSGAKPEIDMDAGDLTGRLLTLRVLKYPKELMRQLLRTGVDRKTLELAYIEAKPFDQDPRNTNYGTARCVIFVRDTLSEAEVEDVRARVERATSRAPLSKYGLTVDVSVVKLASRAVELGEDRELAAYTEGRTWDAATLVNSSSFSTQFEGMNAGKFPPILSTMEIHQMLED